MHVKVFAFGETNAYVFVTNWSSSTEHSTQYVGLITFVPSEQIKVSGFRGSKEGVCALYGVCRGSGE